MAKRRFIISGGGTGGHIFPAISIANAIKKADPDSTILFVGAIGRMEMERVPAAGYEIIGLPIAGLKRSLSISNLKLPFIFLNSIIKANKIIKEFEPEAVIGVGGYASYPTLKSASLRGIPYLIQEQNSFAGVANRLLAKKAQRVCVAYEGMERFFPSDKIIITGNPVRNEIKRSTPQEKREAKEEFGLDPQLPLILIVGGSLGAGSLNRALQEWLLERESCDVNIIWQYGKSYTQEVAKFNKENPRSFLYSFPFLSNIDRAIAAADLVISRAGAGTISELAIAGKATIFVPSPNVAEDHQSFNAKALVSKGAALMVNDTDAKTSMMEMAMNTLKDNQLLTSLENQIMTLAHYNAAENIAKMVLELNSDKKD